MNFYGLIFICAHTVAAFLYFQGLSWDSGDGCFVFDGSQYERTIITLKISNSARVKGRNPQLKRDVRRVRTQVYLFTVIYCNSNYDETPHRLFKLQICSRA